MAIGICYDWIFWRREAGKIPESLISLIRNGHGVPNDRFRIKGARAIK